MRLNNVVLWLTAGLVALPFGQLHHVRLGFVTLNLFELIQIALVLALIVLMLYRGIDRLFGILLFAWCGLAVAYLLASLAYGDSSLAQAVRQVRTFLPFIVAGMVLATPIAGDEEAASRLLALAGGIGALSALIIHYFYPSVIEQSFAASEEVAVIALEQGRIYWGNGLIAFLAVGRLFVSVRPTWRDWAVAIICIVATAGTVSRTAIAGLLVFTIGALIYVARDKSRGFLLLAIASAVPIGLVGWLASLDERLDQAIAARFFGEGDFELVYEQAVILNRVAQYNDYLESLSRYFPIGQGLGKPFSTSGPIDAYITDVSALSFTLPFGILGLLGFLTFVALIWRTLRKVRVSKGPYQRLAAILSWMLVIFLVISLNVDVFARNNAIVWIALLVRLLRSSYIKGATRAMRATYGGAASPQGAIASPTRS